MNQMNTAVMPEDGRSKEQLRSISNTQNMIKVFKAFKKIQLQLGKLDESPEIVYINHRIQEFESDLLVLKKVRQ